MLVENITGTNFFIGLVVGLSFGFILGFIVALRSKKPENNVSAIQLLSIVALFGYILVSFAFDKEVSWVIAVSILATGYGARGGAIIEKILEKRLK